MTTGLRASDGARSGTMSVLPEERSRGNGDVDGLGARRVDQLPVAEPAPAEQHDGDERQPRSPNRRRRRRRTAVASMHRPIFWTAGRYGLVLSAGSDVSPRRKFMIVTIAATRCKA